MNCSFCGTAFQIGVAYCPSCGSPTGYVTPGQATPQHKPPSGAPQPPVQQPQATTPNGLPAQMPTGYQQYEQNLQMQTSYAASGFVYNQQQMSQQAAREAGTQNIFPPIQQSDTQQARQATNEYNAPPQSSSRLSDYKPTSTPQQAEPSSNRLGSTSTPNSLPGHNSVSMSNTMPGLKLSQYGQPPTQPGKLSDYKTAPTQPGKLSDYKPASTQPGKLSDYKTIPTQPGKLSDYKPASISGPNSLSNYKAFSSIPTATPGSFSSMPSIPTATPGSFSSMPSIPTATPGSFNTAGTHFPTQNASYSVFTPPAMPNPLATQSAYMNVPNRANANSTANPSSFVSPGGSEGLYPSSPVGPSPMYMDTSTPKKMGGLLFGSIVVILVIICIGGASAFLLQTANNATTNTTRATKIAIRPVPTVAPIQGPSGNTSVPAISALFSEPQMTTGIDNNNKAKQVTSSFSNGQTIYVSFVLNSKDQKGYVQARWYKGKQLFSEIDFPHDPNKINGYFSIIYDTPTTDGSVELYWSTTTNFSDAKLARVAHFTVTATK